MATALWPKSVARFLKVGSVGAVVDGFEDHMHDLLDHFVPDAGDAELAHFALRFRYELLSNGAKAELFSSHLLNDLADRCERETIQRLFVCPRCHIAGFGLDPLVGD